MHLKQCELIRIASCKLYEALCSACSTHRDHLVKFCLEATCDDSAAEIDCSQICFNLAYAPVSNENAIPPSQSHNSSRDEEKRPPSSESNTAIYPEILHPPVSGSDAEAKWFKVESTIGFRQRANTEQENQVIARDSSYEDATDDHGNHLHTNSLCLKLQSRIDQDTRSTEISVVILE